MGRRFTQTRPLLILGYVVALFATGAGIRPEPITVDQIHERPRYWNKKQVQIEGEIEDVRGTHSLILEGTGSLLDNEILVLSQEPLPRLKENQGAMVIGTVRRMNRDDIERELNLDLDPAIEVEIEDSRNLIIAESIQARKDEPTS